MTNLTDKQRAALEALRDVMKDNMIEISILSGRDNYPHLSLDCGAYEHDFEDEQWFINAAVINELLEQETE